MIKRLMYLSLFILLLSPVQILYAAKGSPAVKETALPDSTSVDTTMSIKEAMKDFLSLKNSEKRSKFKEMKKAIKEFKANKKAGKEVDTNTLLLVLLAIFLPPLAVYLHEGETNNRFWISVLLTLLGLILFGFAGVFFLGTLPAIVYALIVILGS